MFLMVRLITSLMNCDQCKNKHMAILLDLHCGLYCMLPVLICCAINWKYVLVFDEMIVMFFFVLNGFADLLSGI